MIGFGRTDAHIPSRVAALACGEPVRVVWTNELGGVTCEVGGGGGRRFVKWAPPGGPSLIGEVERLRWAVQFVRVPVIVDWGSDDGGSWFVSLPLAGDNAVAPKWKADPATGARAIGEGLRALHESMPVEACPFSWSAQERVADAERRAREGTQDVASWHRDHQPLGIDRALALAREIPDVDRLVVCHGDSCAPNTIIADDGRWSGHVDFAAMGVADRWADLAVATWSTTWNYGPGWEQAVLDAYGLAEDRERTRYYRLLWDLSS